MNDTPSRKSLWQLLWDFDPNALLVVDPDMQITIVNPAFCQLFHTTAADAVGKHAADFLDDWQELEKVWRERKSIRARETHYERFGIYVKKVMFPIPEENIAACIMVDVTPEWRQKQEILALKKETLSKVKQVVDKQMSVAQEIANLLGETTAETKASLLRLARMVEEEEKKP